MTAVCFVFKFCLMFVGNRVIMFFLFTAERLVRGKC